MGSPPASSHINYGVNYPLIDKLSGTYVGTTNETRFEIWISSLSMLHISEWFTGAGLTSVLVSGPHNDYIRWIQRVGLIFAFISFYPYFSAMFKSFIDVIRRI